MELLMTMKYCKMPLVNMVITWQSTLKTYSKSALIIEEEKSTSIFKSKGEKNKGESNVFIFSETSKSALMCRVKNRNPDGKPLSVSVVQFPVSATTCEEASPSAYLPCSPSWTWSYILFFIFFPLVLNISIPSPLSCVFISHYPALP